MNTDTTTNYFFIQNQTQWLVEEVQLSGLINQLYDENGNSAAGFIRAIVCKMYGDLLSKYKFRVLRVYEDGTRQTRKSLEQLDPTGCKLIKCNFQIFEQFPFSPPFFLVLCEALFFGTGIQIFKVHQLVTAIVEPIIC